MKNFLSFFLSRKVFHFLRTALLSEVFFIGSFYLSALWVYYPANSWPGGFLLRNLLTVLLGGVPLEVTRFFSSAAFKILLLPLIFEFYYNVSWEGSFKLILFGDLWVSWTWVSISLPSFGMFLAIISLNKLSAPFSLSACLGTLVIHKLVLRIVSYRSHRLSSTLFILFTLFSVDLIFSKFLSSVSLFFLLIDQVHC